MPSILILMSNQDPTPLQQRGEQLYSRMAAQSTWSPEIQALMDQLVADALEEIAIDKLKEAK